ncbi:MAG: hypothetical protein IJV31_08070 [Clostridia bacterium]|nr:hypothetical protein [Clostridia bacterium]
MAKKMSNNSKKIEIDRYFFKYNSLLNKIFKNEIELDTLNAKKTSINSPGLDEKLGSSTSNRGLENVLIQIEEKESYLSKLYTRKDNLKKKYIKDFKKIGNNNYEIILTQYYLEKLTIKAIASQMNLSIDYIKKSKRIALDKLLKIIKKEENNK